MDSTLVAYVAEALRDIYDRMDYDTAADRAAKLLTKSAALREVTRRYGAGQADGKELRRAISSAVTR